MNSSSLFYFASLKFSSSWFVEFAKSFELLFDFANVFSAVAFLPLDDVALQCCVLCFLLLNFCYLLGNEHVETVDNVEQFIHFLQRIFLHSLRYLIKHLFVFVTFVVFSLVLATSVADFFNVEAFLW